jgi:hypothetical protein
VTREEEAFELRGQATAVSGFASAFEPMLPRMLWCRLHRVAGAQILLAHALTLPPTRFKRG